MTERQLIAAVAVYSNDKRDIGTTAKYMRWYWGGTNWYGTLNSLAKKGYLKKVYGGAGKNPRTRFYYFWATPKLAEFLGDDINTLLDNFQMRPINPYGFSSN